MLLREFSRAGLSPGWIGVRLLAWLSARPPRSPVLMWLNLRGFPRSSTRRPRGGSLSCRRTTVSAVVLLGIAIAHYSYGRRGSRVGAALLSIAIVGSLALPIAARGAGGEPPLGARRVRLAPPMTRQGPHISLLLLDGASLEYVLPRVAAGRLPNFGTLDAGASMDLATIRPTQPGPVWTAVATGMYPARNGVRSAAWYYAHGDTRAVDILPDHCFSHILVRLGIVRDEAASSAALRARPLWSVLGDYGISAGVVRWPLTYPAQPIDGFLITDRFHQMVGSMFEFDGRAAYPADIVPLTRDAFAGKDDVRGWDEAYTRAVRDASAAHPVELSAVRYQSIDTAAHYALRDGDADAFASGPSFDALDRAYANVDREDRRRAGAPHIRRSAAGDVGIRHAPRHPPEAPCGADPPRSRRHRHARRRARRLPARLRHDDRARPQTTRLHRRRHAHDPVLPQCADRPRHGRLRTRRPVPALVHRRPADYVHTLTRRVERGSSDPGSPILHPQS
jgi:hypothetical protein